MLPSTFVVRAGFPERWQEKDLQEYLAERLRQRGFSVQLEVKANGGRADIVSNWQGGTIIEVKKYLDRNTIYQAFGQLSLYGLNNTHKLVVMGFLVVDSREQQSAFTTASMIEQDPRVSVVFVNIDENWLPGVQVTGSWMPRFSLPKMPKFEDWRWWLGLLKNNPLLVIGALALLFTAAPNIEKNSNHKMPSNTNNLLHNKKVSAVEHRKLERRAGDGR